MSRIRNFFHIDSWPHYSVWIILFCGFVTIVTWAFSFLWAILSLDVIAILRWAGTFVIVASLSRLLYHYSEPVQDWVEEKFFTTKN